MNPYNQGLASATAAAAAERPRFRRTTSIPPIAVRSGSMHPAPVDHSEPSPSSRDSRRSDRGPSMPRGWLVLGVLAVGGAIVYALTRPVVLVVSPPSSPAGQAAPPVVVVQGSHQTENASSKPPRRRSQPPLRINDDDDDEDEQESR